MINSTNAVVILQARADSTRFPNKIFEKIDGKSILEIQIKRILSSNVVKKLIVAIPNTKANDELENLIKNLGIEYSRGSLLNVFDRFEQIIKRTESENFVRLTADCPLFMPQLLEKMYEDFVESSVDYMSNCLPPTFPDGLDIEIFKKSAFLSLKEFELNEKELEHVTLGMWTRPEVYRLKNFESKINLNNLRMTVDYPEDFTYISKIFKGTSLNVDLEGVLKFLKNNPSVINEKSSDFRNIAIKSYLENHEN